MKDTKRRRQEIGEMEMEQIFGGTSQPQMDLNERLAGFGIGGMMAGFDFISNNRPTSKGKENDKK